jgi:4-hydroxy-tetrahydrodipicolinate synthase
MRELPDITFGIYECPYPYKRTASEDLMKWCAQTDRIVFIKETSCDIDEIRKKCEAVKDTPLKIYNANTATLMDSLRLGVNGYSGIMANFHADLYVRLLNWIESDTKEDIEGLNSFLTLASLIEHELYPVNAKYRLKLEGIPMGLYSRMKDYTKWTKTMVESVKAVYHLENNWR